MGISITYSKDFNRRGQQCLWYQNKWKIRWKGNHTDLVSKKGFLWMTFIALMKNETRPLPWFKQALKQTVEFQGSFLVISSFNKMLFGVKQITGSHTVEKSAAGGRIIDFMEKKVSWRRSNAEGFRASMWSAREAEPCKWPFKWSFKDYHLNVIHAQFSFLAAFFASILHLPRWNFTHRVFMVLLGVCGCGEQFINIFCKL